MNLGQKLKKIFNPRPMVGYTSEVDKFMEEFNRTHERSPSQLAEIKKHQRVAKRRDNPASGDLKDKIWDEF